LARPEVLIAVQAKVAVAVGRARGVHTAEIARPGDLGGRLCCRLEGLGLGGVVLGGHGTGGQGGAEGSGGGQAEHASRFRGVCFGWKGRGYPGGEAASAELGDVEEHDQADRGGARSTRPTAIATTPSPSRSSAVSRSSSATSSDGHAACGLSVVASLLSGSR